MTEGNIKFRILQSEKILVDLDLCTKCKACIHDCPTRIYSFETDTLKLDDYADKKCMECGHCVAVCSANAIKLKNPLYGDVKEIPKGLKTPSYEDLLTLFRMKRSIRQFKQKPVPIEIWEKLIEAARSAPTGHNFQEVQFIIVRTPEALKQFNDLINKGFYDLIDTFEDETKREKIVSSMPKKQIQFIEKIIPGLKRNLKRVENGEDLWRWGGELLIFHGPQKPTTVIQDCSLAAMYVMLAAHSLKLGTCSLDLITRAIRQNKYLARFIKLPKTHVVPYVLAVGFPNVKYFRIPARKPAKVAWI